jgi:hypothetical protein
MHIANATVLKQADQIKTDIDAGGAGSMLIYDDDGAGIPADADASLTTQVLLATLTLNNPSFSAAVDSGGGGRIDLDITPEPTGTSVATGTATFARLVTNGGTPIVQFDTVTLTGGGGEVELNSVNIQNSAEVKVTGASSITIPEE